MRKFYINNKRGATSIMEVEIRIVTALEDCSILWSLYPDEYKVYIFAPQSLLMKVEKMVEGKKEVTFVPDVYYSHAFYETIEAARVEVAKNMKFEMHPNIVRLQLMKKSKQLLLPFKSKCSKFEVLQVFPVNIPYL